LAFSSGPYIFDICSLLYDYYIVKEKAGQLIAGFMLPNGKSI
jgi:hypothetical protein